MQQSQAAAVKADLLVMFLISRFIPHLAGDLAGVWTLIVFCCLVDLLYSWVGSTWTNLFRLENELFLSNEVPWRFLSSSSDVHFCSLVTRGASTHSPNTTLILHNSATRYLALAVNWWLQNCPIFASTGLASQTVLAEAKLKLLNDLGAIDEAWDP